MGRPTCAATRRPRYPIELPANDVGEPLRGFGHRIDLTDTIAGYGAGALSIVRKAFRVCS